MEFIAFVIAVAVAYQAMKGYKFSKERTLLYLNLSFVLIGTGLLVDGLSNLIVLLARGERGSLYVYGLGYTINFLAQLLAYGLLVFAYLYQTRSMGSTIALAAVPVTFIQRNSFSELILIFLLVYVATQTAMNYSVNKNMNALLVFGAFASLAVAHLFFLLFILAPIFFPLAQIAQLFGFLLLLAMLLRVNQPV
jgi:hypothetical protein